MAEVRLGIDFGGVIIPHDRDRFVEGTLGEALAIRALPGAVETIAALVEHLELRR